jgi:hypothetical protein
MFLEKINSFLNKLLTTALNSPTNALSILKNYLNNSLTSNTTLLSTSTVTNLFSRYKNNAVTLRPSTDSFYKETRVNVSGVTNPTSYVFTLISLVSSLWNYWSTLSAKTFSFGFYYLRGLAVVLFIDACLTDDEPLWEPIEWSLVQTWILFIFGFAWIAENLIVSRYGSYTGRDKRVWMAWYKTFWLIEGYYVINYGVASLLVIVPFYYETNYNLSFVYSWWHWYSRVFFFKFLAVYSIVLLLANTLQVGLRWVSWKKSLLIIIIINCFLAYLIYTHFIITFFGYFTDPTWYQKTRPIDFIQLSHEPARWGWGPTRKDHFTYHNVKTVFWFKNDGPFASSFLLFQTFLFLCLFFNLIWWISLFRRVISMKEVPLTFTTYCVSSLKQFLYFFFFMYILIFFSYLSNYWRSPIELSFIVASSNWYQNFFSILLDYPIFFINLLVR